MPYLSSPEAIEIHLILFIVTGLTYNVAIVNYHTFPTITQSEWLNTSKKDISLIGDDHSNITVIKKL